MRPLHFALLSAVCWLFVCCRTVNGKDFNDKEIEKLQLVIAGHKESAAQQGHGLALFDTALSKLPFLSSIMKEYDTFFKDISTCNLDSHEQATAYFLKLHKSHLQDFLNSDFVKQLPSNAVKKLKLLEFTRLESVLSDSYSRIFDGSDATENFEIGHLFMRLGYDGDMIKILILSPSLTGKAGKGCFSKEFREFIAKSQSIQSLLAIKAAENKAFIDALSSISGTLDTDHIQLSASGFAYERVGENELFVKGISLKPEELAVNSWIAGWTVVIGVGVACMVIGTAVLALFARLGKPDLPTGPVPPAVPPPPLPTVEQFRGGYVAALDGTDPLGGREGLDPLKSSDSSLDINLKGMVDLREPMANFVQTDPLTNFVNQIENIPNDVAHSAGVVDAEKEACFSLEGASEAMEAPFKNGAIHCEPRTAKSGIQADADVETQHLGRNRSPGAPLRAQHTIKASKAQELPRNNHNPSASSVGNNKSQRGRRVIIPEVQDLLAISGARECPEDGVKQETETRGRNAQQFSRRNRSPSPYMRRTSRTSKKNNDNKDV